MRDNVDNEIQPQDSGDISPGLSPEPGMLEICPLCNCRMKLFFINFNEKVLMCENVDCEYPFGYEELQIVKADESGTVWEEIHGIQSRTSTQGSSVTTSTGSGSIPTLAYNEIDQINAALKLDTASICTTSSFDSNFEIPSPEKITKVQEEQEMTENLNKIKNMTIELQNETKNLPKSIKDPKRLRKLKNLGELSGKPLLKPREEKRLKKEQPNTGLGEFKIDINTGNKDTVSSIQIEILDQSNESPDEVKL